MARLNFVKFMKKKYWMCAIGPIDEDKIPFGGDFPPRMAARNAVLDTTGEDPSCSSGWADEAEYKAAYNAKYKYVAAKMSGVDLEASLEEENASLRTALKDFLGAFHDESDSAWCRAIFLNAEGLLKEKP